MKKINQILKNKGFLKTAKAAVVCQKAEQIIKDDLDINNLRVVKFQGQTLFVATSSPTDSQKIFQKQQKLIKKINIELNIKIERISYKLEG